MKCLLFFAFVTFAKLDGITGEGADGETVDLEVRRAEDDGKVLQVSLRVHVIDGNVHINNHRVDHAVITAVHLQAKITCSKKSYPATVHVRVMVTESEGSNGVKILTVQEEIVEIDNKKVVQLDVKEILLHIGAGRNEIRRKITTVALKESRIHGISRADDKHVYINRGMLPDTPYKASKQDMEMFNHVPMSMLKPPKLPDRPITGGEDEDEDRGTKKHSHHFLLRNRSFCRWFHKLSVAARILICLGVLIAGGSVLACCVRCFCCPKSKKMEGQKMGETEEEEKKGEEDEMDEVGPLPGKKPLDEMKLIV